MGEGEESRPPACRPGDRRPAPRADRDHHQIAVSTELERSFREPKKIPNLRQNRSISAPGLPRRDLRIERIKENCPSTSRSQWGREMRVEGESTEPTRAPPRPAPSDPGGTRTRRGVLSRDLTEKSFYVKSSPISSCCSGRRGETGQL